MGGPDEAERWVVDWSSAVSAQAERSWALADGVSRLSASAAGKDRAVRVTVGPSGVVTDLWLDDRVRGWPATDLATEILRTMRRAQVQLSALVTEVAERTVGLDSETGRAVVSAFERRFPPQAEPGTEWEGRRGDAGL